MSTLLPKIIQIDLMIKLVLPNMVATNLATYDNVSLNAVKFKHNLKISSSVTIATSQVLSSGTGPVATKLDSAAHGTFTTSHEALWESTVSKLLHFMH